MKPPRTKICENCGESFTLRHNNGYSRILCYKEKCYKEHAAKVLHSNRSRSRQTIVGRRLQVRRHTPYGLCDMP